MSAGYGGTGPTLTYHAEADFVFGTGAQELYFTLISNAFSGVGFDDLTLQIVVNNGTPDDRMFSDLGDARDFFSGHSLDLGMMPAGEQNVDVSYWLTASEAGAGFGFNYDLGFTTAPAPVPEASTWAMMVAAFAGLGFAAFRRAAPRRARLPERSVAGASRQRPPTRES
jgi:hypothetical protein